MKRILALTLALALTLPLSAFGAEKTGFSDVADGDWFAPYVKVCTERGLMNGVGDDRFAPERTLSGLECSVLALRLYDMMQGGTGDFEPAPEDFGQISIALENGPTLSGGMGDGCVVQGLPLAGKTWEWLYVDTRFVYHKYLVLDISTPEELKWLDQIGAYKMVTSAVATYGGVEYPGVMRFFTHTGTEGALCFSPDDYDAFAEATEEVRTFSTDPGAWYRDAWYYAYTHHTDDNTDSNYYLMEDLVRDNDTTRWDFASRLARVAGDLPAINAIDAIPVNDWQEETLLPLYNAGILAGVDGYGTFYPEGTLTRAEAAAMVARIVDPSLRKTFSLSFDKAFSPFEEGGLYGLKDAAGNVRIPAQYAYLMIEEDGFVIVTDQKGNKGILDTDGNVILPCLYPRIYNSPDEQGLVVVGSAGDYASPLHYNGKKGMIDRQGTVVIPLEYDFLTPFENGQASFMRGEVFGHLLPGGTEVPLAVEDVPQSDPLYPLLVLYGLIGQG